jgi:hypothetical protein
MEDKELFKLYSFLEIKRDYFKLEIRDFEEFLSPSFSPVEPFFNLDLSPFNSEIIWNFSSENAIRTAAYYQGIIEKFKSDNFAKSFEYYIPSNAFCKYENCESFLISYYFDNPKDALGEGEIEYIKICFKGFLYSYQLFIDEVITEIETIISNQKLPATKTSAITKKKEFPLKKGMTDEKIKSIIFEETKFIVSNKDHNQAMEEDEFNRLQTEIFSMIKDNKLPSIKAFVHETIKLEYIRFAFYKIHKYVYLKKSRNKDFQDFLWYFFPDVFSHTDYNAIYSKFTENPYI